MREFNPVKNKGIKVCSNSEVDGKGNRLNQLNKIRFSKAYAIQLNNIEND